MMSRKFTLKHTWLVLALFCAFGITEVKAQDPHFSQFNAAPLQLNPAMAGVYEGQFRVGINYRDQWGSVLGPVPFQTSAVSFDFRIHAFKDDYFAIGLSFLNDQAGEARYSMTQGNFALSYMKKIFGGRGSRYDQYLIAAGQYGFGQQGINWNTLQFSRQFDGQDFNPSLPTGELTTDQTSMYGDLNAGVMWYGLFGKQRSAYAGIAFHHLNAPNISFNGIEQDPLYRRYTFHGGGEYPINRGLTILPSANLQSQGPSFQTVAGAALRFSTRERDEFAIRFGGYGRIAGRFDGGVLTDAAIIYTALEWHDWILGLNFDTNVSSLSAISGGRGAFELSLTYTSPPARRQGMFCPVF
jgi:type IX secretion system PorP/SprF family membrane protein